LQGSIVLTVGKVSNGKQVYPRLTLNSKNLEPLKLEPGDEVFAETRADCIIIRPCHPKTTEPDDE
jgi:hypothetical protein